MLGLIAGKQAGITLAAMLVVGAGLSSLPSGVSMRHIYGASCLAGIGFTMSLFIADLAFLEAQQLDAAKIGILAASVIAGVTGSLVLMRQQHPHGAPAGGGHAESRGPYSPA